MKTLPVFDLVYLMWLRVGFAQLEVAQSLIPNLKIMQGTCEVSSMQYEHDMGNYNTKFAKR